MVGTDDTSASLAGPILYADIVAAPDRQQGIWVERLGFTSQSTVSNAGLGVFSPRQTMSTNMRNEMHSLQYWLSRVQEANFSDYGNWTESNGQQGSNHNGGEHFKFREYCKGYSINLASDASYPEYRDALKRILKMIAEQPKTAQQR